MFTDTHCHLSKKDYDNLEEIIAHAKEKGITKMIANGTDIESNKETLELSKKYPCIYPAIGFHPESLENYEKKDLQFIEDNIDSIIAIGEIGLDYHYEPCDRESQKELFKSQLELAKKYHKPVIVHSRDATEDTINILKEFPTVKGSIHCFSGSLETAKIYTSMGYKIGIGGVVTFKNAKLKEIVQSLQLKDILLETDCPYLSPEPLRGTKNEPANVFYVASFIADYLNITLDELSNVTEENVNSIFDI